MKQFFKILALAALALPFTGCDVEYDPIVVQPDVALEDSGMTTVPTVSIYQNDAYTVTLARTEGLSRAAEFDIVVDEALIDEYNELNGASLEPMPASGYTIGVTSVAFAEKAKTATFSIQFKPQAIVAAAGSPRRAENFVIPFACVPRTTVNSASQSLSALVRFSFSEPTVTVDAPVDPVELTFISGVPVPRRLELSCRANFTTLQTSKLAFAATQEMVDAYNAANQADCLLLPADCYSVDAGTFDAEALTLLYGITVDASALDPDHVYLLPLKLAANDYTVTQDNMYYVKVTIQEIQFTVNNTDRYEAATRLAHPISLDVALNGALADDVPVEFTYDPSKVADYNASKGKAYEALGLQGHRHECRDDGRDGQGYGHGECGHGRHRLRRRQGVRPAVRTG